MATPYIGEIRLFGGTFAPDGWALCDGRTLPIDGNEALFALIGTTYGGDGETNFKLPDMQSRIPIHQGLGSGLSQRTLGEAGGSEQVTLSLNQLPNHTHVALANASAGNADTPTNNYWSGSSTVQQFVPGDQANTNMNTAAIGSSGQSQPHFNIQPYLTISFIIALNGIFPTQN